MRIMVGGIGSASGPVLVRGSWWAAVHLACVGWCSRTLESVEQLATQIEPEMTKKAAQSDFLQKKARGYRTTIKQLTVITAYQCLVPSVCMCVCVPACVCDSDYCRQPCVCF